MPLVELGLLEANSWLERKYRLTIKAVSLLEDLNAQIALLGELLSEQHSTVIETDLVVQQYHALGDFGLVLDGKLIRKMEQLELVDKVKQLTAEHLKQAKELKNESPSVHPLEQHIALG